MNELPGQRTGYVATPRDIWLSSHARRWLPGGIVIDASYAYDGGNTNKVDELRAGWLMAKLSSNGLWVPCKRTLVASGTSGSGTGTSQTTITVENAAAFKAGEVINVPLEGGRVSRTISSINYTTNVITVTVAVTNLAVGQAIFTTTLDDSVADTGCGNALCIIDKTVRLLSADPYNTTWYDKVCEAAIAGYVDEDMVLGDLAAARADTLAQLGGFQWGDKQGQT